jgi:DNA repair photolyase
MGARFKQSFEPQFKPHYFKDKFPEDGKWIFIGSTADILCPGMKDMWILAVLQFLDEYEGNHKFLLQSKNPARFWDFKILDRLKDKTIIGTTVETTYANKRWGGAPPPYQRISQMTLAKWKGFKTFLSLEPLSDFDVHVMKMYIVAVQPEVVEIGLENDTHFTDKPPEHKILELLKHLREEGIPYVLKENLAHLESYSMQQKAVEIMKRRGKNSQPVDAEKFHRRLGFT